MVNSWENISTNWLQMHKISNGIVKWNFKPKVFFFYNNSIQGSRLYHNNVFFDKSLTRAANYMMMISIDVQIYLRLFSLRFSINYTQSNYNGDLVSCVYVPHNSNPLLSYLSLEVLEFYFLKLTRWLKYMLVQSSNSKYMMRLWRWLWIEQYILVCFECRLNLFLRPLRLMSVKGKIRKNSKSMEIRAARRSVSRVKNFCNELAFISSFFHRIRVKNCHLKPFYLYA